MSRLFSAATVVTITLLLFAPSAMAQQIPDPVLHAFTQKFQNAEQATWEIENDDNNGKEYEVEFVLKEEKMSAEFTEDGTWRETEIAIPRNELPDAVKQSLGDNFSEAEVEHAFKIITPAQTLFEVIVESEEEYDIEDDEDIYEITFTMDGKILKNEDSD